MALCAAPKWLSKTTGAALKEWREGGCEKSISSSACGWEKQEYSGFCHSCYINLKIVRKWVCDNTIQIEESSVQQSRCGGVMPNVPRHMTATKLRLRWSKETKEEVCCGRERARSAIWIHSPGLEKTQSRTLHQHLDCCQYRWLITALRYTTAEESPSSSHISPVIITTQHEGHHSIWKTECSLFIDILNESNCWWSLSL